MKKVIFVLFASIIFSMQSMAAEFRDKKLSEIRNPTLKELAFLVQDELERMGDPQDVGVLAVQVNKSTEQSWDKAVRQYSHRQAYISDVAGAVVRVSPRRALEKAGKLTSIFVTSNHELSQVNTESLSQDLQENLESILKARSFLVIEGSAEGPFSRHFLLTIVDPLTQEMIQLYSGWSE